MAEYKNEIIGQVGNRLNDFRKEIGLSVKDFGLLFNNGKEHKSFSSYLKGKNLRFDTLIKFSNLTFGNPCELLAFQKPITIADFNTKSKSNDEFWLEVFKQNILFFRKTKFKTQLDAEIKLGIERANLAHYEKGEIKPTLITIGIFADIYEVEPRDFFIKRF